MILSTTFNFIIVTILIGYSYLFKNLLNKEDNQIHNLDLLYGLVMLIFFSLFLNFILPLKFFFLFNFNCRFFFIFNLFLQKKNKDKSFLLLFNNFYFYNYNLFTWRKCRFSNVSLSNNKMVI